MRNRKGITIIEYLACIPMIIIITTAIYMMFTSVLETDGEIQKAIEYSTESIILDTSIMNSMKKGYNEVHFIGEDKTKGFVINNVEYNFNNSDTINFECLNIEADIVNDRLIVTTSYRTKRITKEYNITYWDGIYE